MFNKGDVMKKRIYEIIEVSKEDDITSHIYDLVMMFIGQPFLLLLNKKQSYLQHLI